MAVKTCSARHISDGIGDVRVPLSRQLSMRDGKSTDNMTIYLGFLFLFVILVNLPASNGPTAVRTDA